MTDYLLCGWRVRSDLPLPELLPWTGDGRAADVRVRLAEVPPPDPATQRGPFFAAGRDGSATFTVAGVARYLVRDGGEILVEPAPEAEPRAVRLFLLGSPLGVLCHRRGVLPLHASCVRLEDGAVAFAGPSGAGKSTLAAALLGHGHAILSDEICVVTFDDAGAPWVLPAFPRLRLWRDALDALGIAPGPLTPSRASLAKFDLPHETAFDPTPVPLRAVYHLSGTRAAGEAPTGFRTVGQLRDNVFQWRLANWLGLQEQTFRSVTRLAGAVPTHLLARPEALDGVAAFAAALAARLAGP